MIGTSAYSQDIFPLDENGEIVYSEIVNVDSVSAKVLYVRAHQWFANTFKSAQDVIQLDDKEAGIMIGKGFFEAVSARNNLIVSVYFTVEIQTKDGRYKYVFSNFSCKQDFFGGETMTLDLKSSSVWKNAVWQKRFDEDWLNTKKDANTRMVNIIDGLKKSMSTNTSNW